MNPKIEKLIKLVPPEWRNLAAQLIIEIIEEERKGSKDNDNVSKEV